MIHNIRNLNLQGIMLNNHSHHSNALFSTPRKEDNDLFVLDVTAFIRNLDKENEQLLAWSLNTTERIKARILKNFLHSGIDFCSIFFVANTKKNSLVALDTDLLKQICRYALSNETKIISSQKTLIRLLSDHMDKAPGFVISDRACVMTLDVQQFSVSFLNLRRRYGGNEIRSHNSQDDDSSSGYR